MTSDFQGLRASRVADAMTVEGSSSGLAHVTAG
jgi:hypothetical protein